MQLRFSLKRVGLALSIAIVSCSSCFGIVLTCRYSQEASGAVANARDLQRFVEVVRTLNCVSAERGPSNAVIAAHGDRHDLNNRLANSRSRSDAGLARLEADPAAAADMVTLSQALAKARASVDEIAARPPEKRNAADIQQAINAMFSVVDEGQAFVGRTLHSVASRPGSAIASQALIIRALSELRDHAGRMGSALMMPLSTGRIITADDKTKFDQAHGRVMELRGILSAIPTDEDPWLRAAVEEVENKFFDEALAIYSGVLAQGAGGHYELDREGFTQKMMPSFRALERLRDAVSDAAISGIEARRRQAESLWVIVGTLTLLMIGLECILLAAAHRLLFVPLLRARDTVLALASGETEAVQGRSKWMSEMSALFDSLDVLAVKLRDRDALDLRNQQLADQLRTRAEQDALTGILNRGALERVASDLLATKGSGDTVGLILFDIDHFKAINDAFGHSGGDAVLKVLARRWSARVGAGATLARFGGEEFAVVLPGATLEQVRSIAEQLRGETLSPVQLPSGASVHVTASFGVKVSRRSPRVWSELVEGADAALYCAKSAGRNAVVCANEGGGMMIRRSAA